MKCLSICHPLPITISLNKLSNVIGHPLIDTCNDDMVNIFGTIVLFGFGKRF